MPRNAVQVIARYWVVALFFALCPFGLPAVVAGVLSFSFVAIIAFFIALGFFLAQWGCYRLIVGVTPNNDRGDLAARNELEIRWFCNNCHADAHDLAAPCWACGYEQYECPVCGSPVKDEFASCNRCGNDPLA